MLPTHAMRIPGSNQINVALIGLLAVAGSVRLMQLADKPLWIDEVSRLVWSKGYETAPVTDARPYAIGNGLHPLGFGPVLRLNNLHTPPLNALVFNAWLRLVGRRDDFALKLPFALIGTLAALALYFAGRELWGHAEGLIAGLLVALSPFQVYYAQEVNHYALAATLTAFSYLFYYRFMRRQRLADAVAFSSFGLLAIYTHYYFALALAAQGIGALHLLHRQGQDWWHRARLLLPFAAVGVGFLPYLPTVRVQMLELTADSTAGPFGGASYFFERLNANLLMPWLGELSNSTPALIGFPLIVLFVVLVALGISEHRDPSFRWALAVNAVLPPLSIFILYLLQKKNTLLWPRYGLFFSFALYLPLAAAIARGRRAVRLLGVAATLVSMLIGLRFYFHTFQKEDWRAAAGAIDSAATPGDRILIFQPNLAYALAQYLRGDNRITSLLDSREVRGQVDRTSAESAGVFLVTAWPGSSAVPGVASDLLSCRYPLQVTLLATNIMVRYFHEGLAGPLAHETTGCGAEIAFQLPPGGCAPDESHPLSRLSGWVNLPRPDASLELFADGTSLGSPTLHEHPAGEKTSGPSGLTRWFELPVDLSRQPPASLLMIQARVRVPGGPARLARHDLPCVRRSTAVTRTRTSSADEKGYLDPVEGGPAGMSISVGGWAFSARGVMELRVLVDGQEVARTRQHGFRRDDVAAAFPGVDRALASESGFLATLDSSGLSAGTHQLGLEIVHPDGSNTPIGELRRFTLARPQ